MAGGSFGGGTGSELDPYLVEDLADFSQAVNNDNAGKHFKQVKDITSGSFSSSYEYWEGSYDGDRHAFENVVINGRGLFGGIDGGNVKNMNIKSVHILNEDWYAGIIGGWLIGGSVSRIVCTDCSVTATGYHGGIIGDASDGAVSQCYFAGVIDAGTEWVVGGIIGQSRPMSDQSVSITKCGFVGNVYGGGFVGGIVGDIRLRASVDNSYARGEIVASSEVGDAGGVSGTSNYVNWCYFAGTITGPNMDLVDGIAPWGSSYTCYSNAPTESNYRSTADMQYPYNESNTYINWNFENIWIIDDINNDMFPYHIEEATFEIFAKKGETWKKIPEVWTKKGGIWKPILDVWAKKDGTWKPI